MKFQFLVWSIEGVRFMDSAVASHQEANTKLTLLGSYNVIYPFFYSVSGFNIIHDEALELILFVFSFK